MSRATRSRKRGKRLRTIEILAKAAQDLPAGLLLLTSDLRVVLANRCFPVELCRGAKDLAGRPLAELMPAACELALEALAAGEPLHDVTITVTGLPMARKVRISIAPLGPEAEPARLALLVSGEAGASGEVHYRELFENAADAIFAADLNGNFTCVNKAVQRLTGYSPEELLRMNVRDLVAPESLDLALSMCETKARGGPPTTYELELLAKDGRRVAAEVSSRLLFRDDKPAGAQGICRDISQRKRGEQALRQSEEQFRALFDNALDLIAIVNDERHYLDANPAFCSFLGVPRQELLGRRLGTFMVPEDDLQFEKLWQSFLEKGEQKGEVCFLAPDGTRRQLEYSAKANFLPGRHLLVCRDVTQRRLLEQRVFQAQKMEAVGQLAGGIAHDFNNLLTIIAGYSELALSQIAEGDALRRDIEEIQRAGERAASLTRQLLAFGRRQVIQPRVLNLNGVISDLADLLRGLMGEQIELLLLLRPRLGSVRADPAQMEQVVLNLAVNAREAMPNGGTLTIETNNIEIERPRPELAPGPYVILSVSDTGVGMDEATQTRVFEPFFTTKPGRAAGLGLATVYGIVQQSGGQIEVASQPGQGATFHVYLPWVRPSVEAARLETPAARAMGSETVLLVEDEEPLRDLARHVLERRGYRVLHAGRGAEALAAAARHDGPIHLLLTDVVMPDMSGPEVAARLASSRPEMKVLYMSGYTEDAVLRRGVVEQAMNFLPKPFTPAELLRKIREVLEADPDEPR